ARSGSSRLTGAPSRSRASAERASVWSMACAAKPSARTSMAVRQTPSTAIESPSLSERPRLVRTCSVTPCSSRSSEPTSPTSEINPVNTLASRCSPLAQARRDQKVLPHALPAERERAHGLGDALDAFALERVARSAAAQQQRREEQPDFVDLAGVEEGAGEV